MGPRVRCERQQGALKTGEAGLASRQAKAQKAAIPIELPNPDVMVRQMRVHGRRLQMSHQSVKHCSADHLEASVDQNGIQLTSLLHQPRAHGIRPSLILKSSFTDGQSRPCNRPGSQRNSEAGCDFVRRNHTSEANACETVELAERAQDHHRLLDTEFRGGCIGHDINKRLVDQEPATAARGLGREIGQGTLGQQAPIGIVGIDHDQVCLPAPVAQIADFGDSAARIPERAGMLVVGGAKNGCAADWCKTSHPLDQRLRAGGGDKAGLVGHAICLARSFQQRIKIALGWQCLPEMRRNVWQRIGMGVDAGRQIEPAAAPSTKLSHRAREITTMQHGRSLPFLHRLRQSFVICATLLLMGSVAAAQTPQPVRVISLNMCTDQLLLDLAPTQQIAGLSPFAADAGRSFLAARAGSLPILSGSAEEVMMLRPDLVVSGTFTKRATREFIRARGVNLEEFAPIRTLAETKRQITRFGEITGATVKAAERNAEIDAALAELRTTAAAQKLRVLPLARRAWVSGSNSLISELLTQAGLVNAAAELGIRTGGRTTLEQIVMLKPDAILISRDDGEAEDQGRALLLHPAIQSLFPPERRIVIPERLTICGGPMLADAMRALAGQISRLKPRSATTP